MPKKFTKYEAVLCLVDEARYEKRSLSSAKRILRACQALEFSALDTRALFQRLEYCDGNGTPYGYGKGKPGVAVWA